MTLGDKIRIHRKSLGMTQTELGQRLGVKVNAVSKWECGRVEDIPTSKIKALANIFNVPISYLIDDEADIHARELPSSANKIILLGRDGRRVEKTLTDAELEAYKALIDLLPDATDDL